MPKKTTTTKKPTIKDKVDEKKEEKIVEEVIVEEEEVTVEEPKEEEVETVEIDKEAVQDKRQIKKDVKIKMSCDHKCHIGGENYELKEGNTYVVPEFVKYTLSKAGVLAPL